MLFVLACKDREAPPTPAPAPAPSAPARPSNTPKPSLPAPTAEVADAAPTAPPTTDDAFAAEPIDTAWRGLTEKAIKQRVPSATDIECHTSQCRLTLTGTQQELGAAMDQLQTEQSLRGIARNIILTAPTKQPDGKLSVRAYAQFER